MPRGNPARQRVPRAISGLSSASRAGRARRAPLTRDQRHRPGPGTAADPRSRDPGGLVVVWDDKLVLDMPRTLPVLPTLHRKAMDAWECLHHPPGGEVGTVAGFPPCLHSLSVARQTVRVIGRVTTMWWTWACGRLCGPPMAQAASRPDRDRHPRQPRRRHRRTGPRRQRPAAPERAQRLRARRASHQPHITTLQRYVRTADLARSSTLSRRPSPPPTSPRSPLRPR
jgi:hypothetical protein